MTAAQWIFLIALYILAAFGTAALAERAGSVRRPIRRVFIGVAWPLWLSVNGAIGVGLVLTAVGRMLWAPFAHMINRSDHDFDERLSIKGSLSVREREDGMFDVVNSDGEVVAFGTKEAVEDHLSDPMLVHLLETNKSIRNRQ